jgi:hypothetical protein
MHLMTWVFFIRTPYRSDVRNVSTVRRNTVACSNRPRRHGLFVVRPCFGTSLELTVPSSLAGPRLLYTFSPGQETFLLADEVACLGMRISRSLFISCPRVPWQARHGMSSLAELGMLMYQISEIVPSRLGAPCRRTWIPRPALPGRRSHPQGSVDRLSRVAEHAPHAKRSAEPPGPALRKLLFTRASPINPANGLRTVTSLRTDTAGAS